MNILITGANGQLGNEMRVLSAENQQYTYFFTDVQELDICDEQAVRAFVSDHAIDLIVNCAAYTAVDKAEDNRELCDKLNHLAPGYLAEAAEACGAALIQELRCVGACRLGRIVLVFKHPTAEREVPQDLKQDNLLLTLQCLFYLLDQRR